MDDLTHTTVAHDTPPAAQPAPGLFDMLPMFVAFMAIFYFLVLRPQNNERRQHEKLIASLQKGDKVLLRNGMFGVVYEVRTGTLMLTIAENVRVEVEKSAVKLKPGASDSN